MSKMDTPELDEKPLDPEVEKVRRKMVRLLAVSIGIMIVGVMAVLAAVVYRISQGEEPETPALASDRPAFPGDGAIVQARATLPQGFSVEDVALDGVNILFFGSDAGGGARAFIFDIAAGRVVADIAVD